MSGKREGCVWMRPEARSSWAMERRRVDVKRKAMREIVNRFVGRAGSAEVEKRGGGAGARMSESVPVRRRVHVEVMAMMEMCVAAEFEDGAEEGGGYRVPIMVPRLLMNASPGPVTRKNPAARNHIV